MEETIAPVRDGSKLESVIAAQVSARDGRFVVIRLEFSHRAIRRHGGRNFMLYCNKALPRDSASTFPAFDFAIAFAAAVSLFAAFAFSGLPWH